jgi:hypothetical protein
MTKRYIAKPDTWFDEGTEAFPSDIFDNDPENGYGLFAGTKSDYEPGVLYPSHEMCSLSEFEIIED